MRSSKAKAPADLRSEADWGMDEHFAAGSGPLASVGVVRLLARKSCPSALGITVGSHKAAFGDVASSTCAGVKRPSAAGRFR